MYLFKKVYFKIPKTKLTTMQNKLKYIVLTILYFSATAMSMEPEDHKSNLLNIYRYHELAKISVTILSYLPHLVIISHLNNLAHHASNQRNFQQNSSNNVSFEKQSLKFPKMEDPD
jgi:uncharacterized membrane protein YbjE (DUF340 family)